MAKHPNKRRNGGDRQKGLIKFAKLDDEVYQKIVELGESAAETLERLLTCGSHRVELAAAQEILDRRYGKPEKVQTSKNLNVNHQSMGMHLPQSEEEQLQFLAAAYVQLREKIDKKANAKALEVSQTDIDAIPDYDMPPLVAERDDEVS